MLSTLATAAPPQATRLVMSLVWSRCNIGHMYTKVPKARLSLPKIRRYYASKSPGWVRPKQPPACPGAPFAQSLLKLLFPTSGREENDNKYLENHSKFLRCSLSPSFTESFRGTNKNLGGWWYTVICVLNRHSLSNSKFMKSPPRLQFEQLCFTNKSSIQQSSNHPSPESSCLVIHKAIASILKRIYRLLIFLAFIVFGN